MAANIAPPSVARVLIVDDHPAVREALAARILNEPDLQVCGEAEDMVGALRQVVDLMPDIAVIDISLKSGDGLGLIKRIVSRTNAVRLLVWSMHSEELYAERALRAGAHGYITKEHATTQIVAAIRHILAGKVYLSPTLTDSMLLRVIGDSTTNPVVAPETALADRELEVFRLIGQGKKTQEIATQLHLSAKTVETYRSRIRQKLDVCDADDLMSRAKQWVMDQQTHS